MPSTVLKLAPNLPVQLNVTGAAVWPGKLWPDPKTGEKKQLPAQLALKGSVVGTSDPVTLYLPAELSGALLKAGATHREIAAGDVKGMGYDLPANRRLWEAVKRQGAGEKSSHTKLYEPGDRNQPLDEVPKALQTPPEPMPWEPQNSPQRAQDAPQATIPAGGDSGAQRLYRDTFLWVLDLVRPYQTAADPEVIFTGSDIAAICATVYIQRNKLGEIPITRNPEAP